MRFLSFLKVSYSTQVNVILLGDHNSDVLKEEIEKALNKGGGKLWVFVHLSLNLLCSLPAVYLLIVFLTKP